MIDLATCSLSSFRFGFWRPTTEVARRHLTFLGRLAYTDSDIFQRLTPSPADWCKVSINEAASIRKGLTLPLGATYQDVIAFPVLRREDGEDPSKTGRSRYLLRTGGHAGEKAFLRLQKQERAPVP